MNSYIYLFILLLTHTTLPIFNYDRAISYAQKDKWNQSKELLKTELVQQPERPDLLYDIGISSYKSGEYDKALSYFTKAAHTNNAPKTLREQAYFNVGNTQVQLKHLQEAIDAYDQALALNPSNKKAAHNKEIVKKMLEQEKQQQQNNDKENKKDQDENNNKQDNQDQNKEKQDQDQEQKESDNQKNNQEENKKNQEQSHNDSQDQKKQKENQNTEQPKKNDQQKSDSNSQKQDQKNKEEKEQDQKAQQENTQQKKSQEARQQEQDKKDQQGTAENGSQSGELKQEKLSPALAYMLDKQEKKDAELNKKMIKAMTGIHGGSPNDYNCW